MHRVRDALIALTAAIALFVVLASGGFNVGPFETLTVIIAAAAFFGALRVRRMRRHRKSHEP